MRKLLLSMLAIFLVIGLVGSGTYAWFQDTETSTGNTFSAGTLDLKVSDANEGFGDGVTATWTMSNMQPGVTMVGPLSVNLQNSGSIVADHVEISFSHSIVEGTPPEFGYPPSVPGDLARWIQILRLEYNGVDLAGDFILFNPVRDPNGNGFFDLEDVTLGNYAAEGGFLDNLLPPAPNNAGTRSLAMRLRFNAGATNDIQGDTLITTVTFTLNQHSSQ